MVSILRLALALCLAGCLSNYDSRYQATHCDVDAATPGSCAPDGGVDGGEFRRGIGVLWIIGDSIPAQPGYRTALYRLMQAYGVFYSTTGTLQSGPSGAVLPLKYAFHDGHDGFETRQMLLTSGLPTWLAQLPSAYDTVFILGGANDNNRSHDPDVCTAGDGGTTCVPGAIRDPAYEFERMGERLVALGRIAHEGCHFGCRVVISTQLPIRNKMAAVEEGRRLTREAVTRSPYELCEAGTEVKLDDIDQTGLHPAGVGELDLAAGTARCLIGSLP